MLNKLTAVHKIIVVVLVLIVGFGALHHIRAAHAASKAAACCSITHDEFLELDDPFQKALRVQDEFNRQYAGVSAAAAAICKAHGWDCPAKVVFDARSFSQAAGEDAARSSSFRELPPPAPNAPPPPKK